MDRSPDVSSQASDEAARSVAILGAGAVGALLGAALARAGTEPTLVTRERAVVLLARDGVTVESPRFGDVHACVRARDRLDAPVDALLVAVKAPHLAAALERVVVAPGVVVPLLNGVEHLATLRARFGSSRVVAGVVRVQAHRLAPTHVVHRAPFLTVTLARPGAPLLAAALRGAGVDVEDGGTEVDVLWGKLARLAGLALATAAADAPLGDVRDDAASVAGEVVAVARAEGAALDADRVVAELDALPDAASSSLRADVVAGAENELDAIAGAVLRAAQRHGLSASATARLADAVERRAAVAAS